MPDLIALAWLGGGLLLMALTGDLLIRGAVRVGRALGASPLVAGLFIVGFGTSIPELFVSLDAAVSGKPGLAVGNIVGSNIANVLLVLALPALIVPMEAGGPGQRRALAAMLMATVLWIGMTAVAPLTPLIGLCFLAVLIGYTGLTLYAASHAAVKGVPTGVRPVPEKGPPLWRALIYVPVGIVGLLFAADFIIRGAVGLAEHYRVPQEYVGLTLLAVGTSLPEIGASMAAAFRRRGDLLVGNILGSNVFNILGAGGLVAIAAPLATGTAGVEIAKTFLNFEHWVMALAALVLAGFILTKARIGRLAALLLLLLYAGYIAGLVMGVDLTGFATSLRG